MIRYDDLGDFTVTPHRIVRDTLFRLGFIDSPYASDASALDRRREGRPPAVPDGPADEILTTVRAGRRLRLRLHAPQDVRLSVPRTPRVTAGRPADLEGHARPNPIGTAPDMGAYEAP